MKRVLNLYSSLGGNRARWNEVKDDIEVTAVELDPELARLYEKRFPNDKVIVTDAHQYLLDHHKEFDFIWSSPPCPSHSRARYWAHGAPGTNPIYPDFKLYEEIVFLENHFKGKYCVENVVPYYEPLIPAKKRGRHLLWTNFNLPNVLTKRKFEGFCQGKNEIQRLCEFHDYDFNKYKGTQRKNKIARNLVDYEAGKTIFEIACGIVKSENINQLKLI